MENKLSGKLLGNLMVLTTILIYSFNTNFMKLIIPEWISAYGLVFLRTLVSFVGFFILALFVKVPKEKRPDTKAIGMMMLGGILGVGANMLFYINGISMTLPIDAFVIRTSQPILIIALSVIFLGSRFTKNKAIGIFLGIIGTAYIALIPNKGAHASDAIIGDLLILGSSISYALFLVLIKPYTTKYNPLIVMKWMSLSGLIVTAPFGIKAFIEAPILHHPAPLHIWFYLTFILIFATMIAYFLSIKALNYISPFVESVYVYLLPITGAIVAFAMGLQKFSWHDPIALIFIIGGFILVNRDSCSKSATPSFPQHLH